ncbi:Co2+/Mg2+ efflux protein ApaG [Gramella sp. AN32]|uniref:Co2+/Mg2+ efflux protein ApaG n=1 Tax=Christiangramia antarctica TaxID=2058158 RepID=A0ABW5X6L9_9FLAO|nr:Co2+/Mg2+ efflux protein ApaG [Gramella sp. AN32]MCM4154805.1 Co2+/Mg2+ efflux protein ApaG [Gramella sp. AN32]
MIQQVTKGIKISVTTHFQGLFYKNFKVHYAFGYQITIENRSTEAVQLKSRFWSIKDALNETEIVIGDGVIGKQPVLQPGESHSYESGCLIVGSFGAMKGFYKMIDLNSGEKFQVRIPNFKFAVPYALN